MNANFLFIFLYPFIVAILIHHYWRNNYYKDLKFRSLPQYIGSIGTLILAFGIIFQVINYFNIQYETQNVVLTSYGKEFIQPIVELFIKYPQMNYYYNDLFGIKPLDKYTKRNIILENQISMYIFAQISKLIAYLETTQDQKSKTFIKESLNKTLKTFLKSTILTDCYKNYIKPNIASLVLMTYMKENYNL